MAEVYHNNIIDIDLESGTLFRSFLNHTIGSGDNNANWYGVRVFRKGEPIALSGCSVQGLFMPASGSAILISDGTHTWVSENEAAVLLPQACYNVKGQFTLAIKIIGTTAYTTTGTVRIIDGVVADTYSANPVAPTAAVPTYQEILAVYDQMVAAKDGSVRFDIEQELTAAQMTQARGNIAAASESDVSDLKSALGYEKMLIDLSDYTVINGIIQSDGTWGGYTSDSYQSALITDIPQEIIVKADSTTKNSTFSFFSEIPNQPTSASSNVYFCASEIGRHTVEPGNTMNFTVPVDCKCIVVAIMSQASGISTIINGVSTKIKDEILTPQSFGAKGDGVTDDTAAFAALNGKTAFIPEGTYVVSHVQYGRKTSLFGAGMGKTIIVQKAGETRDLFDFADADSCVLTYVTLKGQSEETSANDYRALLKIRNTANHTDFSNYSNYEHLGIIDAPASGIVMLGVDSEDPAHPDSKSNWVHHINDIRIERCKLWCMIDETSDNLFSNLYLSEGDKGCLLARKASSNMYCNLKLDQPYYAGSAGNLSGYNDGALLLVKNCANMRFVNIDLQSAYYVGAKVYNSNRIHIDGDINNCGHGANGHGIGLMVEQISYCTFNIAFGYVSAQGAQEHNVSIGNYCNHVSVYANEHYKTDNINNCPDSCFIVDPANISTVYNADPILAPTTLDTNLFVNPLCESFTGWKGTSDFSIDNSGKTVGANSFECVGYVDKSVSLYQTYTDLTVGDTYLALCVVNVEQTSTDYADVTQRGLYIIMASNNVDSTIFGAHSKSKNTTGKQLLMSVGKVLDNAKLEPQFHIYKNNGIYYLGNFMLINMKDLGIAVPLSSTVYEDIYTQLLSKMNDPFEGAEVIVKMDYTQIMTILRTIIDKING